MGLVVTVRLIVLFSVSFSLVVLAGLSGVPRFPSLPIARATFVTGSPWYPAGPEMNTLFMDVYTNEQTEFGDLQTQSPSIDFADAPLIPLYASSFSQQSNLGLTPKTWIGFNEIEFNMANNFWGCPFTFGNSLCGMNIRQGIAHMVDKNVFATQDSYISGSGVVSAPIDNPLPVGSSLLTPNSCGWDAQFPETGALCVVGTAVPPSSDYTGGTAYHLGVAAGADGFAWLQAPGSPDMDAAAAHFVLAGLASGCDGKTGVSSCMHSRDSILSGITAATCPSSPSCPIFFVRNDVPALNDLGSSYVHGICYLFTGSYDAPCSYLNYVTGSIEAFLGYYTNTGSAPNNSWWIYTAGAGTFVPPDMFEGYADHLGDLLCDYVGGCDPFDISLYYGFNSRFVSGIPTVQTSNGGYCSNSSVLSGNAADYMWLCSPSYDTVSGEVENSPCLSAGGDPLLGATTNSPTGPGNGLCSNGSLSADSAGVQAENIFGSGAYAIPVYTLSEEYGYRLCENTSGCSTSNSWTRVVSAGGTFNYFNWLNAYNPGPVTPAIPGTIREGLSTKTHSLSPFVAQTSQDFAILSGVYDSLYVGDPYDDLQYINWMTANTQAMSSGVSYSGGVQGAPPGTAETFRFSLRPDLTFHDGRQVTSYDVAFSYLALVASGSVMGGGLSHLTGITILSPTVFDIGVDSSGVFVLPSITSAPILSARYWTSAGHGGWDTAVNACTSGTCQDVQYTLSGSTVNCTGACATFSASPLMTIAQADLSVSFDPIANGIFVGSGPWECGTVTPSGSGTCTPSPGSGNGANSYTLTAFQNYFRSSQRLAIYLWSEESDTNAVGPATAVGSCFNVAVNLSGSCGHWQQGAGNPNNGLGTCCVVGVSAVSNVNVFFNLNWLAPFEWSTSPPAGIAQLDPLLYGIISLDGSTTYNPAGTNSCTTPNKYYDC